MLLAMRPGKGFSYRGSGGEGEAGYVVVVAAEHAFKTKKCKRDKIRKGNIQPKPQA